LSDTAVATEFGAVVGVAVGVGDAVTAGVGVADGLVVCVPIGVGFPPPEQAASETHATRKMTPILSAFNVASIRKRS
jgi:hypothetical protein